MLSLIFETIENEDRARVRRPVPGSIRGEGKLAARRAIGRSVETIDAYLDELASAAPTPGGGSAAALVAAAGAALVAMVARITRDSPRHAARRGHAERLIHDADECRAELLAARTEDERAYGRVVAATMLPRGSADEQAARAAALQAALEDAAAAPLRAAALALDVLSLAGDALALENANLVSDLGCAAEFGAAALAAAAYNVRINHRFMKNRSLATAQEHSLAEYETQCAALLARIRERTLRSLRSG